MTDSLVPALGDGSEADGVSCPRCGDEHEMRAHATIVDGTDGFLCPRCAEKVAPGWPEIVRALDDVHDAILYALRPAEAPAVAAALRALAKRVEDLDAGRAHIAVTVEVVDVADIVGTEGRICGVQAERRVVSGPVTRGSDGEPLRSTETA